MNPQAHLIALLARLGLTNRQQGALRAAAGLASLGFLGLVVAAGGPFHPLLSLALVALTLLVVVLPDSSAPMFLVLGLVGLWAISLPSRLDAWTLLAAADLLVLHLACTLAAYGPAQLVLEPRMFRLWARRGAVLAAVTGLTWVCARFLGGLGLPSSGVAYAAALALLLVWAVLLWARLLTREGAPPS